MKPTQDAPQCEWAAGEQIELLYDGACPLCSREVKFMQRLDSNGAVQFTDITSSTFHPEAYGLTAQEADRFIHARLPDGRIITGMEVFREVYRRLGLGWLLGFTAWPVFRPFFDALYSAFARRRHAIGRLFGRRD